MPSTPEPDPGSATDPEAKRELQTLRLVVMSAAHQLNNIMSGLLGYADLEQDLAHGKASPLTQTVIEQCDRGLGLSRALMSVADRSYGRMEAMSPMLPLDEVCTALDKYLSNHGVQLIRRWSATPVCRLDAGSVRQAFLELVLHGAQRLPDGGEIEVLGGSDDSRAWVAFRISPVQGGPVEDALESPDMAAPKQAALAHGGAFEIDGRTEGVLRIEMSFPLPQD